MKKEQVIALIAADLLVFLGDGLTDRSRTELEALAAQDEDGADSLHAIMRTPGLTDFWSNECGELIVRFMGSDIEVDEAGDTYRTYALRFDINWSSHSAQVNDQTLQRLTIMHTLAHTGIGLTEKYSSSYRVLVRTAAEEAERLAAAKIAENTRMVKNISSYMVKGLRVNSKPREVARSVFTGIPDGLYEVRYSTSTDTKTYSVRLQSQTALLRRKS